MRWVQWRAKLWGDENGSPLTEFALVAPVLALLMTASYDFARAFYEQQRLSDAAEAGAVYGAQAQADWTDTTDIQNTVLTDANATSSQLTVNSYECVCTNGVLSSPNNCGSSVFTCPASTNQTYIFVTVSENFSTLLKYPFTTPTQISAQYAAPAS